MNFFYTRVFVRRKVEPVSAPKLDFWMYNGAKNASFLCKKPLKNNVSARNHRKIPCFLWSKHVY